MVARLIPYELRSRHPKQRLSNQVACATDSTRLNPLLIEVDLIEIILRRRELRIQFAQGLNEHSADGEIAIPFLIGRNDVPRCVFRGAAVKHLLIRLLIGVPLLAFFEVVPREFPLFRSIVEPSLKSFLLFTFRDMQVELDDRGPRLG